MTVTRVFVSGKLSEKAESNLKRFAEVSAYEQDDPLSKETLLENVADKDALVCILGDRVDGGLFDACPRLRMVANVAVGYDNVDIAAASERGVLVTNTPGVLDNATADLAFALLLSAARRVVEADRFIRQGLWKGWKRDLMLGAEINGKTLGIVGMGRIGEAVARRARAFGLSVLYTRKGSDPEKDRRLEKELDASRVSLDELIAASDFISVHCPLNKETRQMIGKEQFARMKRSCFIINTSRGNVIDQSALIEALESRRIAGAGLDVFDGEPDVPERLMRLDNAVLTPHIGSASLETRQAMDELAVDAVIKAFSGQLPGNSVNPSVWDKFVSRQEQASAC